MKKSTLTIIGCIVGLLLLVCVPACNSYNGMVTLEEESDQSWAEVQNQYQRRLDLIPNLVETVKGYARHESETLENVTNARAGISTADSTLSQAYNAAMQAKSNDPSNSAYNSAQSALNRALTIYVNAVHEAYPDLKANENFRDLQTQLEGTENRIAYARNKYTETIKNFNIKIKRFPGNIVASIFGFDAKPQFEAEAEAAKAPKVTF